MNVDADAAVAVGSGRLPATGTPRKSSAEDAEDRDAVEDVLGRG
jgi:hypothetical protein